MRQRGRLLHAPEAEEVPEDARLQIRHLVKNPRTDQGLQRVVALLEVVEELRRQYDSAPKGAPLLHH